MLQGPDATIERARKLRSEMSLPEVLLWRALRKRPGGLKFRRQHPAGPYVADFFCHEARLVVEIDGRTHELGGRPKRDLQRDAWFRERSFKTVRIAACDVLRDLDAVVRAVVGAASPLHRPSGGPPPHAANGEELAGAS